MRIFAKRIHAAALLAALLLLAPTARAADESYPIKLDRPAKAGDAFTTHIVLEIARHTAQQIPGAAPRTADDLLSGDLTARVDVAAVDAHGIWSTFTLTLQKFTLAANPQDALPAGTVIKVVRDAKAADFSLAGGAALPDDARKFLAALYPRLNDSAIPDDAAFGTPLPQKVGASWPVNAPAAAQQAAGSGMTVNPAKVHGQTSLQALQTVAGKPALRLITHLTMTDVAGTLPAGTTLQSSQVTGDIRALLPVDPASPLLEHETTTDMTVILQITATPGARLTTTTHRHQLETLTPLAP